MIGKNPRRLEKGEGQRGERAASFSSLRFPFAFSRKAGGFTLLELMIVISIIIILALIVLPRYNETVQAAREASLRDDLHQMRKMIDQYAADKGRLPQSLDDLVSSGYLGKIPPDPMTGQPDWTPVWGEDPNNSEGGQGLIGVCSSSADQSSDGSAYNDCSKW